MELTHLQSNTQEIETGRLLKVQGQPEEHSEFPVSLDDSVRCLKNYI